MGVEGDYTILVSSWELELFLWCDIPMISTRKKEKDIPIAMDSRLIRFILNAIANLRETWEREDLLMKQEYEQTAKSDQEQAAKTGRRDIVLPNAGFFM